MVYNFVSQAPASFLPTRLNEENTQTDFKCNVFKAMSEVDEVNQCSLIFQTGYIAQSLRG